MTEKIIKVIKQIHLKNLTNQILYQKHSLKLIHSSFSINFKLFLSINKPQYNKIIILTKKSFQNTKNPKFPIPNQTKIQQTNSL